MSFWQTVKEAKELNQQKVRVESAAFSNNDDEIQISAPTDITEKEGHKLVSGLEKYLCQGKDFEIKIESNLPELLKKDITNGIEKKEAIPAITRRQALAEKRKERESNAGSKWYGLRATKLTPELRTHFRVLNMKNILDPIGKAPGKMKIPKYFEIGDVIEDPSNYYNRATSKKLLQDQYLGDINSKQVLRKKTKKLQKEKSNRILVGGKNMSTAKRRQLKYSD